MFEGVRGGVGLRMLWESIAVLREIGGRGVRGWGEECGGLRSQDAGRIPG